MWNWRATAAGVAAEAAAIAAAALPHAVAAAAGVEAKADMRVDLVTGTAQNVGPWSLPRRVHASSATVPNPWAAEVEVQAVMTEMTAMIDVDVTATATVTVIGMTAVAGTAAMTAVIGTAVMTVMIAGIETMTAVADVKGSRFQQTLDK